MKTILQDNRDKHLGKRAIVCGSGTSLNDIEWEKIKKDIVICVNDAFLKFPDCNYFFATDSQIEKSELIKDIKNYSCETVFCEDINCQRINIPDNKIHSYSRKQTFDMLLNDEKLIKGFDAVQVAVHFAYIMGCSQIYLAGCDCCYIDEKKYFFEGTEIKGESKKGINDNGNYDVSLASSLSGWKKIAQLNPNVPIIDLSIRGEINVFPKFNPKDL